MSSSVSLPGGVAPANFTGLSGQAFAQAGFGANSVIYTGNGLTPVPAAPFPGATLIINGSSGGNFTIPTGYAAFFDSSGNDTVTGVGSVTAFLQGGLNKGTNFVAGSGNTLVYAGGSDTITAGSGSDTIIAGSGDNTVLGSSGSIVVDARNDDLHFVGGSGAVSVVGGSGNTVLFGGTGSASTYLQGGSGNSTLVGGSGTGPSTIGGGVNITAFAAGTGPTSLIAGTGNSVLNGLTGKGIESFSTSPFSTTGNALMALNGAADTVVGGSGHSTVLGGRGIDTYAFLSGHAGGSETILGLKSGDKLIFGFYSGNAIASEAVTGGSDMIKLTDGTSITLAGFDHKLFS
jgi:Ca2+-binding RTX toxin-like protein